MKKIIFIVALSLNFFFLHSQTYLRGGFTKGYILTKTDTIHCYVLTKGDFPKCKVVKYKFREDDKVKEQELEDVKEVYANPAVYKKITYGKKSFLCTQMISGRVSLYVQIDAYYNRGTVLEYFTYYLEKSGQLVKIGLRSYKEEIKGVLSDDPETTKEIDAEIKKYTDISIFIKALVNNYNKRLSAKSPQDEMMETIKNSFSK